MKKKKLDTNFTNYTYNIPLLPATTTYTILNEMLSEYSNSTEINSLLGLDNAGSNRSAAEEDIYSNINNSDVYSSTNGQAHIDTSFHHHHHHHQQHQQEQLAQPLVSSNFQFIDNTNNDNAFVFTQCNGDRNMQRRIVSTAEAVRKRRLKSNKVIISTSPETASGDCDDSMNANHPFQATSAVSVQKRPRPPLPSHTSASNNVNNNNNNSMLVMNVDNTSKLTNNSNTNSNEEIISNSIYLYNIINSHNNENNEIFYENANNINNNNINENDDDDDDDDYDQDDDDDIGYLSQDEDQTSAHSGSPSNSSFQVININSDDEACTTSSVILDNLSGSARTDYKFNHSYIDKYTVKKRKQQAQQQHLSKKAKTCDSYPKEAISHSSVSSSLCSYSLFSIQSSSSSPLSLVSSPPDSACSFSSLSPSSSIVLSGSGSGSCQRQAPALLPHKKKTKRVLAKKTSMQTIQLSKQPEQQVIANFYQNAGEYILNQASSSSSSFLNADSIDF